MAFLTDDEIHSQPECWEQAGELANTLTDLMPAPGERVAVVGAGTAWYMSQAAAALRENAGQGETDAFTATELPRHRRYNRLIVLTRTGRTTEINRLLADFKGKVPTLAFVADPGIDVSSLADEVVNLSFADEASVVQTRFATTVLALFRAWLGEEMAPLVEQAHSALQVRLTDELAAVEQVTYLGHGWTVGLAHEAAMKFRQCSAGWSESYPVSEYRHGPLAVAEPGRLTWMLGTPPKGLAEQVREIGATFVANELDPMAELIITQRLAVGRAMRLGMSPDQPRHLKHTVVLDD